MRAINTHAFIGQKACIDTEHPFIPLCFTCVFTSKRLIEDLYICRFFRSTAYRTFVLMVYGYLRNRRYPLPACAYKTIRRHFMPALDEDFVGFVEEDCS